MTLRQNGDSMPLTGSSPAWIKVTRARPKPPEPKVARADKEATVAGRTQSDVDSIIRRERLATADDLQRIIEHAKEYKFTEGEKNQLSVDLTVAIARRAQSRRLGRNEDL